MNSIPRTTTGGDADGITSTGEHTDDWAATTIARIEAIGEADPEAAGILREIVNLYAEGHAAGWLDEFQQGPGGRLVEVAPAMLRDYLREAADRHGGGGHAG